MPNERLNAVARQLQEPATAALDAARLVELLAELIASAAAGERDERLWSAVVARLTQAWLHDRKALEGKALPPQAREQVVALYSALASTNASRGPLLALLARSADGPSLAAFADLAASDPPRAARDALVAVAPLFQLAEYDAAPLFPRLLDALAEPALAAAVLDLANYLSSRGRVHPHPAAAKAGALAQLLGRLVERLGTAADGPLPADAAARRIQVAESLGLAISLIHTARLLQDPVFTGKLFQAIELPHRRLRVEAAAALAALGEKAGFEALLALTAEPVARGAALTYLEQLGRLEQAPAEFESPVARAEGRLAVWLAEPSQIGMPPTELELLDERRQPWPGFEQPVECFLFRYTYHLPTGERSGVGLVGPITWAFAVDPTELPVADVYALFAGWQAEHEEIAESPFDEQAQAAWQTLRPLLEQQGYSEVRPEKLGAFFGERHLVTAAVRNGERGTAVVDLAELGRDPKRAIAWYPRAAAGGALGPTEAYWLHKGRLLLAAFGRRGEPAPRA
ncbi:MAG: hypothetical protein U0836_03930 [Pirellulales bacterium]